MDMFSNLLDDVLANTSYGPKVIHEQHDVGQIDWLRGMADPGEMLQCGYLPELRRRDHESAEIHYARILPIYHALPADVKAKLDAVGRGAAIQRANLASTGGRVNAAYAYTSAWHQLGVTVDRAMNWQEAINLAGLGWDVLKIQQCFEFGGKLNKATDSFSLVRSDTGDHLATVGARYKPVQNVQAFRFLDNLLGEFGAKFHSAGALNDGRKIFATVEFPKQAFTLNGNDTTLPYLAFINSHGYGCYESFPTATRLECKNTTCLASLQADDSTKYRGRHTGNIGDKLDDVRAKIGYQIGQFKTYEEKARYMASVQMPKPESYFNGILDEVLEVTEAQTMTGAAAVAKMLAKNDTDREQLEKKYTGLIERRRTILDDMLDRWERPANNLQGMKGTAWQGYNTVTEHANHNTIGRQVGSVTDRASRRVESLLNGPANELVQVALQHAVAL